MGKCTCSVDGCDRPHLARGYCSPHWQRWKKSGDPGPVEVRPPRPDRPTMCSVDGCDRPHFALGYCTMHAHRFRTTGDPGPVEKLWDIDRLDQKQCSVDGCDRPRKTGNYCATHYTYVQKNALRHEELKPIRPKVDPLARDEQGRKQCTICTTWKNLDEYASESRGRDGLQTRCIRCRRNDSLRRCYNMTIEEYEALSAAQGHVCAICGRTNVSGKALSVDHDHRCCEGTPTCGKCTRQLLCGPCNHGIGYLQDDPEIIRKAAKYLEEHRARDRSQVRAPRSSPGAVPVG